jgi:large subunit ribosomal protein L24
MSSIQPRKQRKARYDAPLHLRRKQLAGHLSEELLLKYNRRSIPVVTGDEVRILRGNYKGEKGAVVDVDTKARNIIVEGVTIKKADGTDVPRPIDPSNVMVIKLNLEDPFRRQKLGETVDAPVKGKPAKAGKKAAASEPTPEPAKEASE